MKTPRSKLRGIKEVGFALKIRDFQTSGYFSKRSKLRGIEPVEIQPEHPELHVKRLPDLADADVEAAIGEDIEHCELLR